MAFLIPVQYNNRKYPKGISPSIKHVAGHFDVDKVFSSQPSYLHTEYSYRRRKLNSKIIGLHPVLATSCKLSVPRLWFNAKWAEQFSSFILEQTEKSDLIRVIEIHPPFNDYCSSIKKFCETYKIFEEKILLELPNVEILLENRSGSTYKGGKFLISGSSDILDLCEMIDRTNIGLKISLDTIQLLTNHSASGALSAEEIFSIFFSLKDCAYYIRSLHVWGKRRSKSGRLVSHVGDLNTYFDHNEDKKRVFTEALFKTFNDEKERYFVPEVNSSSNDLQSIVKDLIASGFLFIC